MVKSILNFDQTGLIGWEKRSNWSPPSCHFCVNICSPILWQSLRAIKYSQWLELLKDDDKQYISHIFVLRMMTNKTSAIYFL